MKTRTNEYGTMNIIGKRLEEIRKSKGYSQVEFIALLQTKGFDINPTSYSKIEGQTRQIIDKEIKIIAEALNIKITDLFYE